MTSCTAEGRWPSAPGSLRPPRPSSRVSSDLSVTTVGVRRAARCRRGRGRPAAGLPAAAAAAAAPAGMLAQRARAPPLRRRLPPRAPLTRDQRVRRRHGDDRADGACGRGGRASRWASGRRAPLTVRRARPPLLPPRARRGGAGPPGPLAPRRLTGHPLDQRVGNSHGATRGRAPPAGWLRRAGACGDLRSLAAQKRLWTQWERIYGRAGRRGARSKPFRRVRHTHSAESRPAHARTRPARRPNKRTRRRTPIHCGGRVPDPATRPATAPLHPRLKTPAARAPLGPLSALPAKVDGLDVPYPMSPGTGES
jgi:hypothetical protein